MSIEAWNAASRAAFQASWRVMIAVVAIAGPPLIGMALVFRHLDGGLLAMRFFAYVVAVPTSLFVHELGHGVAYAMLVARRGLPPAEQFGIGRWSGGSVVRWALSPGEDAVVAIAGPLAGSLCALPLLAPGGSFLLGFPFVLVFGMHLLSLRASADDGAQIRILWKESTRDAQCA